MSSVARAPALEGSLALRQRFGRGEWSTTLDVGGGYWVVGGLRSEFDADRGTWTVYAMPPISGPGVTARLGLQGLGLRVVGVLDRPESPLLLLGLDLDVPGILATF